VVLAPHLQLLPPTKAWRVGPKIKFLAKFGDFCGNIFTSLMLRYG